MDWGLRAKLRCKLNFEIEIPIRGWKIERGELGILAAAGPVAAGRGRCGLGRRILARTITRAGRGDHSGSPAPMLGIPAVRLWRKGKGDAGGFLMRAPPGLWLFGRSDRIFLGSQCIPAGPGRAFTPPPHISVSSADNREGPWQPGRGSFAKL